MRFVYVVNYMGETSIFSTARKAIEYAQEVCPDYMYSVAGNGDEKSLETIKTERLIRLVNTEQEIITAYYCRDYVKVFKEVLQ